MLKKCFYSLHNPDILPTLYAFMLVGTVVWKILNKVRGNELNR